MQAEAPRPLEGRYDPAFTRVAERFAASVAAGEERGALALRIGGRAVLDLHGGAADPASGAPWRADSLACCFSVTKGVFALLAHVLIDRGRLDLAAPVARYWPGFAAAGKAEVSVDDMLTHRAGLPAVAQAVPEGVLYDAPAMEAALAVSPPVLAPGTPAYHNMTYGHLLGGLMARAAGAPAAALIASEIAGPLGADFRIGLSALEAARAVHLTQDDPGALWRALDEAPHTLFARSMRFFARGEDFNSARWRGAVIGSGSGHATAAAIARIYEQFVLPGGLLSGERRAALAAERWRSEAEDPVLGIPIRMAQGLELSCPPALDFGPSPCALGYWGAGGAQGFADPDSGLAFGYVTGRMDPAMGSSPRARALVAACHACL